jgi:hypothetical protein
VTEIVFNLKSHRQSNTTVIQFKTEREVNSLSQYKETGMSRNTHTVGLEVDGFSVDLFSLKTMSCVAIT